MIISINQPAYLPWPGYFARILKSDLHVVLDHVQFEKNSLVNRNKIRTSNGWTWLTVPVKTKNKFGNLPIYQLEISNNSNWASKHLTALKLNYSRSPHCKLHIDFFDDLFSRTWTKFCPLVDSLNLYLLQVLNINTRLVKSSSLSLQHNKSRMILEICKNFGATTYLSGPFGRDYLDEQLFIENGIEIQYHDYVSRQYSQVYPGFESSMSIVDLVFNHGPNSIDYL